MSNFKNRELLERWKFSGLKVNLGFLSVDFEPSDKDKDTAWALYIELETRITTQILDDNAGDEETALTSVYNVFTRTRELLIKQGREAKFCTPVALAMLNCVIRPFTAKWHKLSLNGAFNRDDKGLSKTPEDCLQFRQELKTLQESLIKFSALFSAIAYGEAKEVNVEEFMKTFTTTGIV